MGIIKDLVVTANECNVDDLFWQCIHKLLCDGEYATFELPLSSAFNVGYDFSMVALASTEYLIDYGCTEEVQTGYTSIVLKRNKDIYIITSHKGIKGIKYRDDGTKKKISSAEISTLLFDYIYEVR